VCFARFQKQGGRYRRDIGTEFTFWTNLCEAAAAARFLAMPRWGPACLGLHALVWADGADFEPLPFGLRVITVPLQSKTRPAPNTSRGGQR
jgi:hypothetical protein